MLVEKSQELIQLSQHKKNIQNYVNNLQEFKTRQKQITDAIAIIKPVIESLQAFRQRGMTDFNILSKVDALLEIIIEAETEFQKNSDWLTQKFNGKNLKSKVESLKTSIEQQLTTAWKKYLERYMPRTNNEILNLFGKIEGFKNIVHHIRILNKELNTAAFPKNNIEFEKFEDNIKQLNFLWNSLSSDEVPESILQFLKAAATEGASLELLTPEVMDWIQQHSISDSLRVHLN